MVACFRDRCSLVLMPDDSKGTDSRRRAEAEAAELFMDLQKFLDSREKRRKQIPTGRFRPPPSSTSASRPMGDSTHAVM